VTAPLRFHPQASLRPLGGGWELSRGTDRHGGVPLRCVLSDLEALCVGLIERGVDPCEALAGRIAAPEALRARVARLRGGLRGFRPAPDEAGREEPLFPAPEQLLGHRARALARPLTRDFLPAELVWYVTTRCPRRCRYCHYVQKGRSDLEPDGLALPDLERMARQARRSGVERFTITGGEPLLRRDLPEIVSAVAREGLELLLFTRARWSRARALRYRAAGLEKVYFSIDSLRPEVNRLTVENARVADEALESIAALSGAGMEVAVVPVVSRASVAGLFELGVAVARAGAARLRPLPYKGPVSSEWNELLALDAAGEQRALEQLGRLERWIDVDLSTFRTKAALTCCESGFSTLYVMPGGEVTYCPLVNDHRGIPFGKLPGDEISELWYSRRLLDLMRTNGLDLHGPRRATLAGPRSACVLRESRLDVI
jgi:MoaA/NifB/PqqE/SkfB family radical SAM enzyme